MKNIRFQGTDGVELAGELELPQGRVRATALFAHCFTCSKDNLAVARVSRELARLGFAVLRFDFTGLGESEGEFADTNFTSNVEDLLHAAEFLREHHTAPSLLIGHSLGGAAVLRAAHDVPECRAVATIGAPFDPAHVANLLGPVRDDLEAGQTRDVSIAGRTFTIKPQFLDDISSTDAPTYIGKLDRALLILHSPRDQVVGIDNATKIFVAAKHPKSFVSLDDADHLLSRPEDATFVANIIAAWSQRYVPLEAKPREEVEKAERHVLVTETGTGKFTQRVVIGPHEITADEPTSYGGDDLGPSPYELLLTALGSCTSMTMRMYAERKGWDVGKISVALTHHKIHARDCMDCDSDAAGLIDRIERRLNFSGELTEEQIEKLMVIADKCPVHRTIEGRPHVVTTTAR